MNTAFHKLIESPMKVIAAAIIASIVLGFIDYITTPQVTFSVFYFVFVAFTTWYTGRAGGFTVSACASIIWIIVDIKSGERYSSIIVPAWNTFARFATFAFVVLLLVRLRELASTLERRVDERTAALSAEVAERKLAEERLRGTQEFLARLLEHSPAPIFVASVDHRVKLINTAYERAFHLERETIIGKLVREVFPEETASAFEAQNKEVLRTLRAGTFETTIQFPDGPRFFRAVKFPLFRADGELDGIGGFSFDITNERKIADALEANERNLQAVFDNAHDAFVLFDDAGTILKFNGAALKLLGNSREDLANRSLFTLPQVPPPQGWSAIMKGGTYSGELTLRRGDGSFVETECRIAANILPGVHLAAFDNIAERKAAERALQLSEKRSRTLIENNTDFVCLATREGQIKYVSPSVTRSFGYTPQELADRFVFDYIHPDDLPLLQNMLAGILAQSGATLRCQFRVRHTNGSYLWLDVSAMNMTEDPDLRSIIFNARDITERKRDLEELQRAHEHLLTVSTRLESIREEEKSRIAIEIHDEFGQVLTALKMDLAYIVRTLARTGDAQHEHTIVKLNSMSKIIDSTVDRVRQIATNLRPETLDDMGLVGATADYAKEFELRTGIICTTSLPSDPVIVAPDRATALFRVVQEALTNAARHAHATTVAIELKHESGSFSLEIRDDGTGITEDQAAGVKSIGIVGMKERAMLFGGSFAIKGRPGKGTTVRVTIPDIIEIGQK
ncbi:MAG TPA: PAS domain S-box protein [Bacteroidota bacterium]|nr:PAS domain S-box protein [Bacteroidota bacterium]